MLNSLRLRWENILLACTVSFAKAFIPVQGQRGLQIGPWDGDSFSPPGGCCDPGWQQKDEEHCAHECELYSFPQWSDGSLSKHKDDHYNVVTGT